MTLSEYRAHPACNFSSLKHLLVSPAHYQAALNEKRKPTRDMIIGTLVHSVVLEGKGLQEVAAIKRDGLRMDSKEGKAFEESVAKGKEIISLQEALQISGMAKSIFGNPHAAHMLGQCQHRETPILANVLGVECKALTDAHGTDGEEWWIFDLKTTDDVSPDAFGRKVASLHYDMQASLYQAVLSQREQIETRPFFAWIAVEKTAPFTCAVYSAAEWETSGDEKMERVLRDWKECTESGEWPQPWQGINILPKPRWA